MSDDLKVFCEVFQRRSFSGAARALNIDPSAVSRRIGALESELDVALFLRTTRKVVPTTAGEQLYASVIGPLQALDEARKDISLGSGTLAGPLRVAAPAALGRARIGPIAHAFCREHPQVEFHLLLSDKHIDLVANSVDVAVRVGAPSGLNLVTKRIGTSPQRLVAAPAYLSERPPLESGFAGHSVVLVVRDGELQDYRKRLPPEQADQLGIGFVCDDLEGYADAIFAGLGVGVLPAWLVDAAIERGELVELPFLHADAEAPVFAVLPLGRRTTERARAFLVAVERAFALS